MQYQAGDEFLNSTIAYLDELVPGTYQGYVGTTDEILRALDESIEWSGQQTIENLEGLNLDGVMEDASQVFGEELSQLNPYLNAPDTHIPPETQAAWDEGVEMSDLNPRNQIFRDAEANPDNYEIGDVDIEVPEIGNNVDPLEENPIEQRLQQFKENDVIEPNDPHWQQPNEADNAWQDQYADTHIDAEPEAAWDEGIEMSDLNPRNQIFRDAEANPHNYEIGDVEGDIEMVDLGDIGADLGADLGADIGANIGGDVALIGEEFTGGLGIIGPQFVPSNWKHYTQDYIDQQARDQHMLNMQKIMRNQFENQDVWLFQDGAWYKGKVTHLDNISYNNSEPTVEIEYEYNENNTRQTDRVTVPAMSSALRVTKDWGNPGNNVQIGTWKPGSAVDPEPVGEMGGWSNAEMDTSGWMLAALSAIEGEGQQSDKTEQYNNLREQRQQTANDRWQGKDVYVNIDNRWYRATVNDIYLSNHTMPVTRFDVTVMWDDPNGKTMNYVVPADARRLRLQSDGTPPLREGGIARYEPFTQPQISPRTVDDLMPLEQVYLEDKWREIKRVDGLKITFTDGSTYQIPFKNKNIPWRARGRIHTVENPKHPKFDEHKAWLDFMDITKQVAKSGPKGKLARQGVYKYKDHIVDHTSVIQENDEILQEWNIKNILGETTLTFPEYLEQNVQQNNAPLDEDADPLVTKWNYQHILGETDLSFEEWREAQLTDLQISDQQETTPPPSPQKPSSTETNTDYNQNTGHAQVDTNYGVVTDDTIKHIVETKGFGALEQGLGLNMAQIYERYAQGRFSWQHDTVIPEWLQPNLSKIYGGPAMYESLIKKYEHDPDMMYNLERVETAVRAPNVLRYLDKAHNELKYIYHNGNIDADDINNITHGVMPQFSYNSQGHIVLIDDKTIHHDNNFHRNVVHTVDSQGNKVTQTQMNFVEQAKDLPT